MENKSDRFDLTVTVLIALVTVFGAVIAWRASLASEVAGDAEQQGLLETLTLEEGLASHETRLYTELQYFARYTQHKALAQRLRQDEATARSRGETALADDLAKEAELYEDLAANQEDFFDVRYVLPDGTFDEARRLADLRQADVRINALDPERVFAAADAYQGQSELLVGLISLLTVALFLYTLSQITEHRIKYPLAVMGSLIFLASAAWFVILERMLE